MEYVELSIENVKEKSKELYNQIIQNYDYDLVIFVAKGAYLIGKELSKLNNVPLLEIQASRKGNKLKKILKPLLKLIPKKLNVYLRKKEMNSSFHENNPERMILIDEKKYGKHKRAKKILLVDDSVDSGNTIAQAKEKIKTFFPKSRLKIAVFNYFEKSEGIIKVDYSLYTNTMINGPWSNDSKYHTEILKEYEKWQKEV